MNKFVNRQSSGQSILEVLFATTVVALVLVAVLSTIIASLRNARISMEQAQATSYASEALEWLRHQRDGQGWIPFKEQAIADVYCLPSLPADITGLNSAAGACVNNPIPNTSFVRELTIDHLPNDEIQTTVTVTRPSRSGPAVTTLEGRFNQWQ
jgi:type II secretory pathway pseudopilin PulG